VSYLKSRETELIKDLTQTRHELQATMEALGQSRAETEELREWIQKVTETG
jgi:hypothetical protein